jgi:hypothetical protein
MDDASKPTRAQLVKLATGEYVATMELMVDSERQGNVATMNCQLQ